MGFAKSNAMPDKSFRIGICAEMWFTRGSHESEGRDI